MHFKDMKWYMKVLMGFLCLLLSPVLLLSVLAVLGLAIVSPLLEIPYYTRCTYHRVFGEKYSWLITRTPRFRVFRRLRKCRPDVAFPPTGNDRFHCFTVGSELIFFGIFDRFVYDAESGEWCAAAAESDEPLPLPRALAEYPHYPDSEKYPTTGVRILADARLFYEENLHRAVADPRFIVYKSKRELKKRLLEL